MPKFSIVVPAYNEANKIVPSLTQIFTFMRNFSESFEVLVVDDGSTDNTVDLVDNYAKDNRELRLIKNEHKGKGPTVWSGMKAAKGDYIYMADADLSTPIDELKKLHNWMTEHDYDIVIASREGIGAERINEPLYRHIMGRGFNLIVQVVALRGIKDSQCGFKLFKRKVAKDIFQRLKVYGEDAAKLGKSAYMGAFDVEVLYLARKLGYSVKEVSVPWTYVQTTRLNPLVDSFRMAVDVMKIKINDIKGLYNL